ncbi:MAG: hypothetical protein JXR60_00410 [Bacteroidales bacterium]|nr:hypothetical protein [Bacteroidales bacterium]
MKYWDNGILKYFIVAELILLSVLSYSQNTSELSDSLLHKATKDKLNEETFFEKIYATMHSNPLFSAFYAEIFKKPVKQKNENKIEDAENAFKLYSGLYIRRIYIVQLNVLGERIFDTISYKDYQKKRGPLSKIHINTAKRVILKNLYFTEQDTIDPNKMLQNEIHLRLLGFIQNALIQIDRIDSTKADVYIVTKDNIPWDVVPIYIEPDHWRLNFRHNNIAGYGGDFNNTFLIDNSSKDKVYLSNFKLSFDNLGGTFINTTAGHLFTDNSTAYYATASRPLLPYKTKWGGSISAQQVKTLTQVAFNDSAITFTGLKQNIGNVWLGRLIGINIRKQLGFDFPIWLVPAIRYTQIDYIDRPDILLPEYSLKSYKMILGSVGLSSQKYYKVRYIEDFGKVEDIPYGFIAKLTGGYQLLEDKERAYTGIKLAYRKKNKANGIYYIGSEFGSFYNANKLSQGAFISKLSYLFPLYELGNQKIRTSVLTEYVLGINRADGENIFIQNSDLSERVILSDLTGTQKLLLHAEANWFTSLDFYGFRCSVFAASELGWIDRSEQLFATKPVGAISLGIRVKNDYMIFSTIQLRFTFYSKNIESEIRTTFDVNELSRNYYENFSVGAPSIINY